MFFLGRAVCLRTLCALQQGHGKKQSWMLGEEQGERRAQPVMAVLSQRVSVPLSGAETFGNSQMSFDKPLSFWVHFVTSSVLSKA